MALVSLLARHLIEGNLALNLVPHESTKYLAY